MTQPQPMTTSTPNELDYIAPSSQRYPSSLQSSSTQGDKKPHVVCRCGSEVAGLLSHVKNHCKHRNRKRFACGLCQTTYIFESIRDWCSHVLSPKYNHYYKHDNLQEHDKVAMIRKYLDQPMFKEKWSKRVLDDKTYCSTMQWSTHDDYLIECFEKWSSDDAEDAEILVNLCWDGQSRANMPAVSMTGRFSDTDGFILAQRPPPIKDTFLSNNTFRSLQYGYPTSAGPQQQSWQNGHQTHLVDPLSYTNSYQQQPTRVTFTDPVHQTFQGDGLPLQDGAIDLTTQNSLIGVTATQSEPQLTGHHDTALEWYERDFQRCATAPQYDDLNAYQVLTGFQFSSEPFTPMSFMRQQHGTFPESQHRQAPSPPPSHGAQEPLYARGHGHPSVSIAADTPNIHSSSQDDVSFSR